MLHRPARRTLLAAVAALALTIAGYSGGEEKSRSAGGLAAYVWLESGRMANDVLARPGSFERPRAAPAYTYPEVFARSEQLAREARRALWAAEACAGNMTRPA